MNLSKLPYPANKGKLHYSKYQKNYEHIILESIPGEACAEFGFPDSREGRIDYIRTRFNSEVGDHYRGSKLEAITHWIAGLALDLPFYNEEIMELAIACGSVEPVMTERQELNILSGYFRFMASHIMRMINKAATPGSINQIRAIMT